MRSPTMGSKFKLSGFTLGLKLWLAPGIALFSIDIGRCWRFSSIESTK